LTVSGLTTVPQSMALITRWISEDVVSLEPAAADREDKR
jgi:hypothetical protein